jgi:hypothetical protein
MFKRISLAAALTLVLVILFGTFAQAGSSSSSTPASNNSNDKQRLVLISRTSQEAEIDVGKKGLSLGDYFVFSDKVYQHGKRVGTDGGTCTIVHIKYKGKTPKAITVQCLVTASLPKGQITTQGLVTFPLAGPSKPFKIAITGGTGAYKTAHGQITVIELPNGTHTKLIVDLILDH